jgi:L,D-transpeptidase catalytic domain
MRRDPNPLLVPKHQTIQNTQSRLPKAALNLICSHVGIPRVHSTYRIHGTNEPETIGRQASSGCIRMRNIDAIDLYNRIKVGATVVVI